MTLLLTLLIVVLAAAIVALVAWEILHRRSELVKLWNPSSYPGRVTGGLGMLEGGTVSDRLGDDDPEVIVLLHGLGATADYFGDVYEGLGNTHRLVMPDLLGFGRSLDERRDDFSLESHIEALDGALTSLGLADARVLVAAHSMGSAIALEWAARHADRVTRVVLWGPPVYPDAEAAEQIGENLGGMVRLFLTDTPWAERACALSCRHRTASGWVMAAASPRWPPEISRRASLHTWRAYSDSLRDLVLHPDWPALFDLDVPVTVFRGTEDRIGDREHLTSVARRADIVDVEGADHHVALTHPHLLFDLLE